MIIYHQYLRQSDFTRYLVHYHIMPWPPPVVGTISGEKTNTGNHRHIPNNIINDNQYLHLARYSVHHHCSFILWREDQQGEQEIFEIEWSCQIFIHSTIIYQPCWPEFSLRSQESVDVGQFVCVQPSETRRILIRWWSNDHELVSGHQKCYQVLSPRYLPLVKSLWSSPESSQMRRRSKSVKRESWHDQHDQLDYHDQNGHQHWHQHSSMISIVNGHLRALRWGREANVSRGRVGSELRARFKTWWAFWSGLWSDFVNNHRS